MAAVRLKDIAAYLNTSVVTVSNALSGKKGVSDSLRNKIVMTAEELGYDTARYHERKQEEKIRLGVLLSENFLNSTCSFSWMLYQQVLCAAAKRKISVLLKFLNRDVQEKEELSAEWSSSIDGLLVIGRIEPRGAESFQHVHKVPTVLLGFQESGVLHDSVTVNDYIGAYRAVKYLLERGHEKIGFVGALEADDLVRERYYGFRRGMEEYRKEIRREWVLDIREHTAGIRFPERLPTAFVCGSLWGAALLYETLGERGCKVPEDVSLIVCDDTDVRSPEGDFFSGQVTFCRADRQRMAETAVTLLLRRIENPDSVCQTIYMDSEIQEGNSIKTER